MNKFVYSENPWNPLRLTSVSLSSSLRLSDELFRFLGRKPEETETLEDTTAGEFTDDLLATPGVSRDRFELENRFVSEKIPWTANLSLSYSESRFNPERITKNMWLNFDGNLRLTKNWRIQYNARMDLEKKMVISQDFRINRDLHCWEASFTWTPTGPYKRFYLRINIKSSMLQDIKLEKRGGRGSVFNYY